MTLTEYLREQQHTYITPEQIKAIVYDIESWFPCLSSVWAPPAEPVEKLYPLNWRWSRMILGRAKGGRNMVTEEKVTRAEEIVAMIEEIRALRA